MKILIEPNLSRNIIATVAIGQKYLENFTQYALPSWRIYCERHGIGLVVFDEHLIEEANPNWKKPNWQKLLIGEYFKTHSLRFNNICHLDTDIIISPIAPNIFDFHEEGKISVISQMKGMPYPDNEIRRRISFFRNRYYDKIYPLDSALFASLEQVFGYHDLAVQNDYFCTGVFIFNMDNFSEIMKEWFYKYPKDIITLTGGGEEPHLNFEIQNLGKINLLDYKFQALWTYEMAWKYPFLYKKGRKNKDLVRMCIEASLLENYFLHFAGSWYESDALKVNGIYADADNLSALTEFNEYLKVPVSGEPVGIIRPS